MPANLPPQYFVAEEKFRKAKNIEEKISALREMLAILPKHKGTDKMKAELRRKLAELIKESQKKSKKGGRSYDYIPKEGAGQAVLVGPPNSGKSSFFKLLTNANTIIADYPFSTINPSVGMMPYEDIQIQIIDLPPIWEETESWVFNIIRYADLIIFFLDLSSLYIEDYEKIKDILKNRKINIENIKGIILANKWDIGEVEEEIKEFSFLPISVKEGINIEHAKNLIFEGLEIVRVYTKKPGYPPNLEQPFVLQKGSNVLDVAESIHKDLAKNLKYAKLWDREGKIKGLHVEKGYIVKDGDILEFHS
jgi:ribosome-interacting GTPase 1